MKTHDFIRNFREGFGETAELPIAFWYSNTAINPDEKKINGCFFKEFKKLQEGSPLSLNADIISCGGGKLYTGFAEMGDHIPKFVSQKERYKKTPDMVLDYVDGLDIERTTCKYLNLQRIDKLQDFDDVEGLIFLATPDILSGLATWTYYDTNADDAVTAKFGSGCSAIITQAAVENRKGGKRCFLGLFDPSARPNFEENILSFTIPMSRFKEMYATFTECSLIDTRAWGKIKERINQ